MLSLAWAAPKDQLFGLSLVKNPPTRAALNTVSAATGNVTVFPGKPAEVLFGTSDLVAAVPKHGLFYFLGDTSGGATLVALNLTTGAEVCSKTIDLSEVGYVGIGQTLDYDAPPDVSRGLDPPPTPPRASSCSFLIFSIFIAKPSAFF